MARYRVEFQAAARREIFTDFTIQLSVQDSYDSDPPSEAASNHDLAVILSLGWIFKNLKLEALTSATPVACVR